MATITNVAPAVINAVRNSASINYQNYVPYVTANADNLKEIGTIICDNPALRNEFIDVLIQGIFVKTVEKLQMANPFNIFKRPAVNYGDIAQEIWIELADVFDYKPSEAYSTQLKRVVPNARSAFHFVNYKKFYKATIEYNTLTEAFMSEGDFNAFTSKIVDNIYNTLEYDEFQVFKYLMAVAITKGYLYPVATQTITKDSAEDVVAQLKTVSGMMRFPSRNYNPAGVLNRCEYDDQYIITTVEASALMSTYVLAYMFQSEYTRFKAHYFEIDSFGALDIARLNELLGDNPDYYEFSEDELAALNQIPAILIDKKFFYSFDRLNEFSSDYVNEGLYWNYWLHTWRCYSTSPFANQAILLPSTPTINSVSVTPTTANVVAGTTLQLNATVDATTGAPLTVNWTSDSADVTVSATGLVTVPSTVAGGTTVTITVTSNYDSSKSATATINVVAQQ